MGKNRGEWGRILRPEGRFSVAKMGLSENFTPTLAPESVDQADLSGKAGFGCRKILQWTPNMFEQ